LKDFKEVKEVKPPLSKNLQQEIAKLELAVNENYEDVALYSEFQQTFFVSYSEPESFNTKLIGQKFLGFRSKTR